MTIRSVELANTFDVWRVRTNEIITVANDLKEGNIISTGTITLSNPDFYNSNVTLNVSNGMIRGDAGLLSNVGPSGSITNEKLQNNSVTILNQGQVILTSDTIELGDTIYLNVSNLSVDTEDTSTANIPSANVVNVAHKIAVFANAASAAAYSQANTARTHANNAYAAANSAGIDAATAISSLSGITTAVNLADANGIASFAATNAAFTAANAGFDFANTRFASAGGTITGDVDIQGSLSVKGNTYLIDAVTLNIADPIIYLASNNRLSDVVDIGFIANYQNATSVNVKTGIIRDATTKEYYVFDRYTGGTDVDNSVDTAGNNFTIGILNSDIRTNNIWLNGQNTTIRIDAAFDKANTTDIIFDATNAAFEQANTADANGIFANTVAIAAFEFANSGASPVAVASFNKANAVSTNTISVKIGTSGDYPGQIAITNTHIYFSSNTYDGTENVWKSVPLNGEFNDPAPYLMAPFFYGTPSADATIFMHVTTAPFTLPVSMEGSYVQSETNVTGDTALIMSKNGANIGVVVFAAAGNTATFAGDIASSEITFEKGDVFKVNNNPSADATLTNIAMSFLGQRK